MEYQSLNKILESSFKKNWDRPALSNYKGITLKYSEVARWIAMLHIAFEQCGLKKGDKVAICSKNQAHWGVCFLAALTYGAVPVPILHEFKSANIHYLVNHSEARVFFVDSVIWEGLTEEEMTDAVQVVVRISDFEFIYAKSQTIRYNRLHLNESFGKKYPRNFGPNDLNYYEDTADELALINYTSGTSGFSKGVMIPYRALYNNVMFSHDAEPHMNANSEVVAMLPSAHMYGMMFEFLFEMTIGAHVHFLTRLPSPKIILAAFADVKPDVIVAVPLIIEKIYKSTLKPVIDKNRPFFRVPILNNMIKKRFNAELKKAFGDCFEEVILGGAAFNPEVEDFLQQIEFPFTVGYGMTECAPIITYAHWDKTKLHSAGKAVRNMEVRIDSKDPENIPGEVQVRGANVFLGYYKNEEATAECFTSDGWFKTGDMGVIDSEGYLFLRGRNKCMILGPSGQNIYPEELEAVINNLSYVVDSLVIEDNGGLTALVFLDYHSGAQDGMDNSALEAHIKGLLPEVNKELPNYAQIKTIEFMPEDFERTPKKSIKRYLYQRNTSSNS